MKQSMIDKLPEMKALYNSITLRQEALKNLYNSSFLLGEDGQAKLKMTLKQIDADLKSELKPVARFFKEWTAAEKSADLKAKAAVEKAIEHRKAIAEKYKVDIA